jgi:SOS response regulatory protein OraA/RecX
MLEPKAILESTAIQYLSFRPRFKAEIYTRLGQKAEELNLKDSFTLINQIVESLEKSGFLDDQKLLESYIRSHLCNKTKGPYWIRPRLLHFGLNKSEVDEALKIHANREIQIKAIGKFLAKKCPESKPDLKTKARLFRALSARGFSGQLITEAFDQRLRGE